MKIKSTNPLINGREIKVWGDNSVTIETATGRREIGVFSDVKYVLEGGQHFVECIALDGSLFKKFQVVV